MEYFEVTVDNPERVAVPQSINNRPNYLLSLFFSVLFFFDYPLKQLSSSH